MEQIRYQGYARDRGFNPIQIGMGSVDAMAQQSNAVIRQMRENQSINNQNRSDFLAGMRNAQQMEAQNRQANYEFEQRSRERFQEGVDQNLKQQVIDAQSAQQNLDQQVTALSVLAPLSQTLGKIVVDWKKKKDENDKMEGYRYEYINGPDPSEVQLAQTGLDRLKKSDELIQATADQLQSSGAAPEAVRMVRKTSKMFEVGRTMARAEIAARQWPAFLQQQRRENNQLQVPFPDPATGQVITITPQTAVGDLQLQAVNKELFKQYVKANGLLDINPALIAEPLRQMRNEEIRQLDEARLAFAITSSDQMLDDVKASVVPELSTNPGSAFNRLTAAFSRSLDQQGNPLGFRTARQKAFEFIQQGIDSNDINRDTLDAIGNSPTPHQPNKSWRELYPFEFAKLEEELDSNYLEDSRRDAAVLQQDGKQWADKVLSEISQNPQSKKTLDQLIKYSIDNFGTVDDRLQYYVNNYSQEKIDSERLNSEFERLAQANRLSLEMVSDPRVPWSVRKQWEGVAKQQSDARNQTGDFKAANQAIESAILAAAKYNSATGDPKHYTIPLATASAKARFNSIVSTLIQSGKSTPEQAAQQALQQVITDIGDGTSGSYAYSQEDQRGFINFGFDGYGSTRQSVQDATKHLDAIKSKIAGGGLAAIDRYALIPKATLVAIDKRRDSPNIQPPAAAQFISELYGGTPSAFEVLNRQLQAQGFRPLPIPEPLQEVERVISPRLRQLLTYRPSPNRSMRAYASVENFNPTLVPNGYGQLIAEVASANGVSPGLLAGLVKVESGFNPNAVSRAGATGLGQLMPDTARGLGVSNSRDPRQNLQGAARYLRQMMDQFNGDLTAGLRAYNQGPGNQQRYPNGVSEEARAYPRKVLQAAASFGFNPNGGSVWRNSATMRPKLVYRIDSIGPTSTGPHLDVKDTQGAMFGRYDLDRYIEVDVNGSRKPISTVITDDQAAHRRRGSHGIDFAYPKGTPVFLKNGAQIVSNTPTEHGDKLIIQIPDGRTFSFLHGRKV